MLDGVPAGFQIRCLFVLDRAARSLHLFALVAQRHLRDERIVARLRRVCRELAQPLRRGVARGTITRVELGCLRPGDFGAGAPGGIGFDHRALDFRGRTGQPERGHALDDLFARLDLCAEFRFLGRARGNPCGKYRIGGGLERSPQRALVTARQRQGLGSRLPPRLQPSYFVDDVVRGHRRSTEILRGGDELFALPARLAVGGFQRRLQRLRGRRITGGDCVIALLRLARHGVLHRPQFSPGDLRFLQRLGYCPPVRLGRRDRGVSLLARGITLPREKPRRRLNQGIDYPIACSEIFITRDLELVQMRGHGRVRGLQSAVKVKPYSLIGRGAELVQFLPAFAQLADGFGVRIDGHFAGGGPGELLRFGRELLATLPAAPALPVPQAQLLAAQRFNARGERGNRRAALERLVDRRQQARQVSYLSGRVCRLGSLHVALYRAQTQLVLLDAPFALVRAVRIAHELPLVGARIAPVREPVCEYRVQFPFGNLWKPAPLLDRQLLACFVGGARNGQRLQEFRPLHHAG